MDPLGTELPKAYAGLPARGGPSGNHTVKGLGPGFCVETSNIGVVPEMPRPTLQNAGFRFTFPVFPCGSPLPWGSAKIVSNACIGPYNLQVCFALRA